jgi:hypothetical protein
MSDQLLCRGFDHRVRHAAGFGCNDTWRQTRENVGIVGLRDAFFFSTDFDGRLSWREKYHCIRQLLRTG